MKVLYKGKPLEGTSKEILIKIKDSNMFTESQTKKEYVEGLKDRFYEYYGLRLNTGTPDEILENLAVRGIIRYLN